MKSPVKTKDLSWESYRELALISQTLAKLNWRLNRQLKSPNQCRLCPRRRRRRNKTRKIVRTRRKRLSLLSRC